MEQNAVLARVADDAGRRLAPLPQVPRWVLVAAWLALGALNGWNWYTGSDAYQESHGSAKLAHPASDDCAIAGAIVGDLHNSRTDAGLARRFGDTKLSLSIFAAAVGGLPAPFHVAGADADWRWCAGLGAHLRSIGWVRLGDVVHERSRFNISLPGYNPSRTQAVVFTDALPSVDADAAVRAASRKAFAGDFVYLQKDPRTGVWTIIGRGPAN